ncbi:MAG: DHH family phosphoesterase [Firmicutes bacterium]|nr:DHH family phosphoesterase [Bacillota bacterium]
MRKEKWMVRAGRAKPLVEAYGLDPVFARIVAGRLGSQDAPSFLDRSGELFNPVFLKDLEKACSFLTDYLGEAPHQICIVGDYDVDGVTSTAILYLGISHLFPKASVSFRIPERMSEGYGINLSIAEELVEKGVEAVITCDNGISAAQPIRYLMEKGVHVIVTDHHEIPKAEDGSQLLPPADFVINPHRDDDLSPWKDICGAFVAYQLIRHLFRDEKNPRLLKLLSGYAAMGTVCDVMPLVGDNRRLVYQGLRYLQEHPSSGIRSLMEVAQVSVLDPYTVGFRIGPMLNAGGRLGSQNKYVHVLLSDQNQETLPIARELMETNHLRQEMTEQGVKDGLEQAAASSESDKVKVIYLPDLHESIAGLVAGKLKEKLYRPILVLTKAEGGLKGSGRSIEPYMMIDELFKVKPLFSKVGGHAMAAGFSLDAEPGSEEEVVARLRDALNENCVLTEEELIPTVWIDAVITPSKIRPIWIDKLEALAPYGVKNPRPQLAFRGARLLKCQIRGAKGNVINLLAEDEGGVFNAVCFDRELIEELIQDSADPETMKKEMQNGIYFSDPPLIDMVFEASIDTYYRDPRAKLTLSHIRYSQNS